jgi:hypothetical protein
MEQDIKLCVAKVCEKAEQAVEDLSEPLADDKQQGAITGDKTNVDSGDVMNVDSGDVTNEDSDGNEIMNGFPLVRFLKTKTSSEVSDALRSMISEAQDHTILTRVHSDAGGEFQVADLMKQLMLHQTKTAASSPQSNGRVERLIGLLKGVCRALMIASKLNKRLWPFAFEHAVRLRQLKQQGGEGGEKLSKLPVFGQRIVAQLDRSMHKGLTATGVEGIYVGGDGKISKILASTDKVLTVSTARPVSCTVKDQLAANLEVHTLAEATLLGEGENKKSSSSASLAQSSSSASSSSSSLTSPLTSLLPSVAVPPVPQAHVEHLTCAACRGQHKTHSRGPGCRLEGKELRPNITCGACRGNHV